MAINNDMPQKEIRPVLIVYPSIYSALILNYLICKGNVPLSGIILSDSDIKVKGKDLLLISSVFALIKQSGLSYTLYMLFVAKFSYIFLLIWNLTMAAKCKELTLKTVRRISKDGKIPMIKSKNINSEATLQFIEEQKANIIVSGYNNQILKYKTCKKLEHGAINIHNAYLPDFRGLDAAFEALYRGVQETGVTIHYIDKGVDTGRIILQEKTTINKDDTVFSLNMHQWLQGAMMLTEVLNSFRKGVINTKEQDLNKAKYLYNSFPECGRVREFMKKGGRFISLRDIFAPDAYIYEVFK
jgi:folate-dependent phosphoribosylglycinamide formyltransferase PurN